MGFLSMLTPHRLVLAGLMILGIIFWFWLIIRANKEWANEPKMPRHGKI